DSFTEDDQGVQIIMNKTKIDWCDYTWNPITGCSRVSEGCDNCYAHAIAETRLKHLPEYKNGFSRIIFHKDRLGQLSVLKKQSGKIIFVCSMSDFFHPYMGKWQLDVMYAIKEYADNYFVFLTKRPVNMVRDYVMQGRLSDGRFNHCFFGISAENQERFDRRMGELKSSNYQNNIVSLEPLLGPIDISNFTKDLKWVIVGAESGIKARPMSPDWVRSIRDQCLEADIPFFFKGYGKKSLGKEIDGKMWNQYPKMMNKKE
ncbi:unnamed protein product, partial [marine sediment metagenome]